jgi:hypothetical protein
MNNRFHDFGFWNSDFGFRINPPIQNLKSKFLISTALLI